MNITEEDARTITLALPRGSKVRYYGKSLLFGGQHVWLLDEQTPLTYDRVLAHIPDGFLKDEITMRLFQRGILKNT